MSNEQNDMPASETPQGQTQEPKVIKRYSNRKLYDTERSKYVTLDEIAKMIKAGEEVTIIDNETKEDLTSVTLTQIIYEEEKRESRMPLSMLRNLIQTGGEALTEFFDKSLKTPALEASRSVEKGVEELKQSALGLREAATRSVTGLTGSARRLFTERKAEELEERLKARIEDVKADGEAQAPVDGNSAPTEVEQNEMLAAHKIDAHVTMLKERLDAMRQLIDELERLG
jgi:polyhydroxyalkanoate synthesis repressor PhaR